jgi:sarcosine oxidase, subunit delta
MLSALVSFGLAASDTVSPVSFPIPCPTCGERSAAEFLFVGELPDGITDAETTPDVDFARAWLRRNAAGAQPERWFHADGCRRVVAVVRDTQTNQADGLA